MPIPILSLTLTLTRLQDIVYLLSMNSSVLLSITLTLILQDTRQCTNHPLAQLKAEKKDMDAAQYIFAPPSALGPRKPAASAPKAKRWGGRKRGPGARRDNMLSLQLQQMPPGSREDVRIKMGLQPSLIVLQPACVMEVPFRAPILCSHFLSGISEV